MEGGWIGGWDNWVTGTKEGTRRDEHWVLYYIWQIEFKLKKKKDVVGGLQSQHKKQYFVLI